MPKATLWRVNQNFVQREGRYTFKPEASLVRLGIFDSDRMATACANLLAEQEIHNFAVQIGNKPVYTYHRSKRVQRCPECTQEWHYADIAHLRQDHIDCDCGCTFQLDTLYPLHPTHELKVIKPARRAKQTA